MENENLWKNILLEKGGDYKLWANAPSDFNLNQFPATCKIRKLFANLFPMSVLKIFFLQFVTG